MPLFVDLTGKQFTYWIVVKLAFINKSCASYWFCRCKCGTERNVKGTSLTDEVSKSCGCWQREKRALDAMSDEQAKYQRNKLKRGRRRVKKIKGFCECGKPTLSDRWQCEECAQKQNAKARERHRKLKVEVISAYGKTCFCCGESRIELLSIDHISGGGNTHRKSGIHGHIYRWLKKNNFPDGFRTACHNCNLSLGFYGYCPHQREREQLERRAA